MPQELDALVRDKPKAWEQALYVSGLVQRVAPLQSRSGAFPDFVGIFEALPRVCKHATGPVDMGSLGMYLKIDDKRHSWILKRLDGITKA